MENIFSKIALLCVCTLIVSCQFDSGRTKILKQIDKNYYVLKVAGYTIDDGVQIGYSIDEKGSYGIISSDCNEIYYNNDTIMFSKILVEGGDTTYQIIPINPKRADGLPNDPIQVGETVFKNNIIRFSRVNLSDKTSL